MILISPSVKNNYIILTVILLLIWSGYSLIKNAENEIKDVKLKSYNRSLMSLRLTRLKIESYLLNLRDKITIETFRHRNYLNDIFSHPEEHAGLLKLIQKDIRQQLPNAYTSTLANTKGESLLPDFDGFIGESCELNLQQFASDDHFEIRVHPNMNTYHFDIMVKFEPGNNNSTAIFFTSFTTDKLKSILNQGETEQNQLFLLFNEVEGLIEVSSMGSRLQLDREVKLTDDELNRLSMSEAIKNTSWTLVNLPDKNRHHNVINRIIELTLFKILLLYIISASLIYIIYTEIKNRRKISDRYQLFLEKTDIAFLVFDEQGAIHTVNNAMLKMSGKKSKKSILGSNLKQWVNAASLQKIKAQLAQVDEHGQVLNLRVERLVESDIFQPMQMDIILDRSSEGKRYALFCKDLSQIYRMERLNQEKQAAIISDKQKSVFLANVSHELRTPMHGILSYSAMGIKRTHTVSLDKLKQYFTNINLSGNRLLTLLNDLLDLSKLEAGHMEMIFSREHFIEIVQNAITEQKSKADEKNQIIVVEDTTEKDSGAKTGNKIELDKVRMHQVVANILSNAIKFTPPGGRIDIQLKHSLLGDKDRPVKAMSLIMKNEGNGIPKEDLSIIFKKFRQSTNLDKEMYTGAGGTGLGLAICKEITEAHHGVISANSELGKNATFVVTIPVKQVSEQAVTS